MREAFVGLDLQRVIVVVTEIAHAQQTRRQGVPLSERLAVVRQALQLTLAYRVQYARLAETRFGLSVEVNPVVLANENMRTLVADVGGLQRKGGRNLPLYGSVP